MPVAQSSRMPWVTPTRETQWQPHPVVALLWDNIPLDALDCLMRHPRLEVLAADVRGPEWIPLAHRMAGLVVVARSDPLRALCYVITSGIQVPIVMAVPRSGARVNRELIRAGAADCVDLPITPRAVERVLTHLQVRSTSAHVDRTTRLVLDPMQRSVRYRGAQVRLAPREFAVLDCLSAHSGDPVSAEEVLMHVWGHKRSRRPRQILEVTIHELRQKLGRIGVTGAVVTIRGYGYSLQTRP